MIHFSGHAHLCFLSNIFSKFLLERYTHTFSGLMSYAERKVFIISCNNF